MHKNIPPELYIFTYLQLINFKINTLFVILSEAKDLSEGLEKQDVTDPSLRSG